MTDEEDTQLGINGDNVQQPPDSSSRHWLKPQHNADSQRLSDVLRDITRLVSDWVWEISPDLKFTYMSPRIFETLGFHPAELRDMKLLDLGTPVNNAGETVEIDWWRPFRAQPFLTKNKLNEERLIELSGVPVFDPETGDFQGVRGTAIDTTERREYERKLQTARDDAEMANRHKSDFLHRLVDEIRTPLKVIRQTTRNITALAENSAQTDEIAVLKDSTSRIEGLVREILDLARLEAGQMDFSLETLGPTSVVDECLEDVKSLADKHKVRILGVHQWEGSIAVDRQRFKQVLLNLITNGIKYNRVGGQLTVSTSKADSRRYRLSVSDEGAAFPEGSQEELFEPFSPLRKPEQHDGTGLGLAISKQLVEKMHGNIGVCGDAANGSTFWIEFPAETKID